jgi:hypothetical protein
MIEWLQIAEGCAGNQQDVDQNGCMLIIHEPLDVPVQMTCPNLFDEEDMDLGKFLGFVLTQALVEAQVVEAEAMLGEQTPTRWRARIRNSWGPERILAETPHRLFRTILALCNNWLLEGQLYGGCVRRVLRQGTSVRTVVIHTGNEQASGFWIRIVTGLPTDR